MALKWLRTCAETHDGCQSASTFVPTRLVDCGEGPKPVTRLVLGKDLSPNTGYVTLSHCWGQRLPILLLKNNLASMLEEIRFDTLPKTFQDAIIVTRRLKKRYIWIDCFCIIQDDDDMNDWQKEAKTMANIYSKSCCNISATAAVNSSHGLFRDREPIPQEKVRVKIKMGDDIGWFQFIALDVWKTQIDQSPLNRRAWVCQERFLSPCNLHFGRTQLFWECKRFSANEVYDGGFGDNKWPSEFSDSKKKQAMNKALRSYIDSNDPAEGAASAYEAWYQLLANYTARKLSFQQDRLVAISGLAAQFGGFNQDQYLAGLWRSYLASELTWECTDPEITKINSTYTAPSWSWAAVDGPVSMRTGRKFECAVEILNIEIRLGTDDPFGAVKAGILQLKGSIAVGRYWRARCRDEKPDGMELCTSVDTYKAKFAVQWDMSEIAIVQEVTESVDGIDSFINLFVLIVGDSKPHPSLSLLHRNGLVLKRTEKPGVFKRLGSFSQEGSPTEDLTLAIEYFNSIANRSGLEYEEDGERRMKYSITII